MERIEFGFFDAGGGHRAAATALQMAIQAQRRPWEIRLTNLQEVLDDIDILKKYAGIRIQDFYNGMLRNGWTLGSTQLMRVLQLVIRAYRRQIVRLLERHWEMTQPDMLVSFVPHFNRALCESYRKVFPGRPFVTILTDLADYPPHFWIERQEQFFVCGSEKAVAQAIALGHGRNHIFQASGMILHPRFYEPQSSDVALERHQLNLLPDVPTALVLFGGHGNRVMVEIVDRLARSEIDLQLILICGKNRDLARALREKKSCVRYFVEGFTNEIPYYMHISDFFIGKPGPGSISEAVAEGLPVIAECNAWTLPQERYNAEWIRTRNVGIVLRSFRNIVPAVAELLQPERLAECRKNASRETNRAVFEIPDFLDSIFERIRPSTAVEA
ncbi:MAG TPA: glycosyltransferase [Candidatus Acidoferrales bacterium]|nr:glycosyltransferase [Candidatus Acidoferrales bacterium]